MSNIIPPLLSTTPPPIDILDDDEDEFGEFTTAVDISYGCDDLFIPNTPISTPIKTDVNSNKKDYLDKRKMEEDDPSLTYNSKNHLTDMPNVLNDVPSELNSQNSIKTFEISSAIVPENISDFDCCTGSIQSVPFQNVINREDDDFLREEPPEIIPGDNQEDFSEFSTNFEPIIVLSQLDVSIKNDILLDKHKSVIDAIPDARLDTNEEYIKEKNVIIPINFVKTINEAITDINKEITFELNTVDESHVGAINQVNDFSEERFNSVDNIPEINKPNEDVSQGSLSDDEFGDFETPSVSNHQVEEKTRDSSSKSNMTSDDEEFCDFKHIQTLEAISHAEVSDLQNKNNIDEELPITKNTYIHDRKTINEENYSLSKSEEAQDCDSPTKNNEANALKFEEEFVGFKESDDFGEFASSDLQLEEEDDEFGEFAVPPIEEIGVSLTNNKSSENRTDDFGDFEAAADNFGDFKAHFPCEDDDFGKFENSTNLTMDVNNVLEKSEKIIIEMFAVSDIVAEDFSLVDYTSEDYVFKEVRDVTDTNALTYQWAKSRSQKSLLKALNIDTRNILYGSGWNPSMPKFAANLSMSPLEPMKSDILTPTRIQPTIPSNASQTATVIIPNSTDIPSAQFDWNGSGLTNPLDSVSNDEKISTKSSVTPATVIQNAALPPQISKSSNQFDSESVNSLQFNDLTNESEEIKAVEVDDFEDFTSFQSTSKVEDDFHEWSGNVVPLRETYINNVEVIKKTETDEPGWLKPTILTPVLSRRVSETKENELKSEAEEDFNDFQTSTVNVISGILPTEIIKETKIEQPYIQSTSLELAEDDDEFDDFTSFQSSSIATTSVPQNISVLQPNILQPTGVFKPLEPTILTSAAAEINWPDPGITDDELARFEMYSNRSDDLKISTDPKITSADDLKKVLQKSSVSQNITDVVMPPNEIAVKSKIDDSEFSGFMTALPEQDIKQDVLVSKTTFCASDFGIFNTETEVSQQKKESKQPKHGFGTTSSNNSDTDANTVSQDTGLFKKMQHKHIFGVTKNTQQVFEFSNVAQHKRALNLPMLDGSPRKLVSKKIENKQKIQVDDDDWTDFVSNQEPIKPNLLIQRTHTPELSLSIPQLSQIQPPKLPIPVITPQGLMQTKIPSVPTHQTKVLTQQPLHVKPSEDGYQPAIISNQFAMQFNQNGGPFMSSRYQTTSLPTNQPNDMFNIQNGFNSQNGGFNPNPQFNKTVAIDDNDEWSDFVSSRPPTNGLSINSPGNYSNWSTNLTPNIITNPVHYQNLDGKQRGGAVSQTGKNVQIKKKGVTSVSSMPELDFVAPKSSHRTLQNKK